jgi:hypothetical protein
MYYSFHCPYCEREYYTFNENREIASHTLYISIKQHLIDFDEDHKEFILDDGEQADSNQIYAEMKESNSIPLGAYEATNTSLNEK